MIFSTRQEENSIKGENSKALPSFKYQIDPASIVIVTKHIVFQKLIDSRQVDSRFESAQLQVLLSPSPLQQ
jgi:hypothetical protein